MANLTGSDFTILVSRGSNGGKTFASEFVALVSVGPPPSRYIRDSELTLLVSNIAEKTLAKISDVVALVSYAAEGTEKLTNRSWGFNLDQHQFYVLSLGMQGTFVFDVLSTQWAQWQTQGFTGWNMENGVEWNGEVYAGDDSLPILWRMDPDSFLDDDFRPIKRVVTGGIPAEARETMRSGMFVLSATKEGDVDTEGAPYVQLSISDDGGETYKDRDAITLNTAIQQDFSWRGLGTIRAPGRVFKITDEGGFVTIKGADQHLAGEEQQGGE